MDYVIDYNGYYTNINTLGTSHVIKEFCIVPIKGNNLMRPLFNIVKPLHPLSQLAPSFLESYQKYIEPAYEIDWSAGYISAEEARELIIKTLEKAKRIYIRYEKLRRYLEQFTGKYYGNILILEDMNFKLPTTFFAKTCSHHKHRKVNHCALKNALVCALGLTNPTLLSKIVNKAQNQAPGQREIQAEATTSKERSPDLDSENVYQHKKMRKSLHSSMNVVTEEPRSLDKCKNVLRELTAAEEFDDMMKSGAFDVTESPDSDHLVMDDSYDEDVDIDDGRIIRRFDRLDNIIDDEEVFGKFIDDVDGILRSEGVDDEL